MVMDGAVAVRVNACSVVRLGIRHTGCVRAQATDDHLDAEANHDQA